MSLRAVERTAMVAGPIEEVMEEVHKLAKPASAVDCLELCIRQHAVFRVRLFQVLHRSLLPFSDRADHSAVEGDNAAGPLASL